MTTTTSTSKKLTKVDRFHELLAIPAVASNPELVDFINHEIELLGKKNSNSKPTEKQVENNGFKALILDFLATDGKPHTVAEIRKGVAEFEDATPQRITALMYQLIADCKVEKIIEKRVSYFRATERA